MLFEQRMRLQDMASQQRRLSLQQREHASSEQVLQYALDRFAAACGYAGIKSGTETSR